MPRPHRQTVSRILRRMATDTGRAGKAYSKCIRRQHVWGSMTRRIRFSALVKDRIVDDVVTQTAPCENGVGLRSQAYLSPAPTLNRAGQVLDLPQHLPPAPAHPGSPGSSRPSGIRNGQLPAEPGAAAGLAHPGSLDPRATCPQVHVLLSMFWPGRLERTAGRVRAQKLQVPGSRSWEPP